MSRNASSSANTEARQGPPYKTPYGTITINDEFTPGLADLGRSGLLRSIRRPSLVDRWISNARSYIERLQAIGGCMMDRDAAGTQTGMAVVQ